MQRMLKVLGEPTRLKILRLLKEKELCVCDLEEIMQISQPRISQHLKVLREAGLVNERREAQRRILRFNQEKYDWVVESLNQFMITPLDELPGFKDEHERLVNHDGRSCERIKGIKF